MSSFKMILLIIGVCLLAFCVFSSLSNESFQPEPISPKAEIARISWVYSTLYQQDEMDDVLLEWSRKNHIPVDVEHILSDYDVALKTKINAGKIPEIWVNRAGADNALFSEYCYDWSQEPIVKRFDQALIERSMDGGAVIGLPWGYEEYSIIYNQKIWHDENLQTPPRTLGELKAVCKALQDRGITPFVNSYKDVWVFAYIASHFMKSEALVIPAMPESQGMGERAAQIPLAMQTLDTYIDFEGFFQYIDLTLEYGGKNSLEQDWRTAASTFARGSAAMMYSGNWCEATVKKGNPYMNLGMLPLPVGKNPEKACILSNVPWVWKVNKNSKNFMAAKELLVHFLASDGLAIKPPEELATQALLPKQGLAKEWQQWIWRNGFDAKFGEIMQGYIAGNMSQDTAVDYMNASWTQAIR